MRNKSPDIIDIEGLTNHKASPKDKKSQDFETVLDGLYIDPTKEVPEPPVIIWLEDTLGERAPLCTLGNFSLLIGKAKSRKTFLITSIAAAAISGKSSIDSINGCLPNDRPKVLLFDTEQGAYHLQKAVQRICRQTGIENPENFRAFGLRNQSPAERLALINWAINNLSGIGLIIVDGLKDLLSRGINDELESIELISSILKWTADKDLHIMFVLHQNKNDANARGHIGSEAVNKAETTLSVEKDSRNKEISVVKAEYCRNIEFESFSFTINRETGLPEQIEGLRPQNSKVAELEKNFKHVLSGKKLLTYSELVKDLMEISGKAERSAKRYVGDAMKAGIISKNGDLYKLSNNEDTVTDLPF